MEWGTRPSQVGPLRHRFQMIDRFGRFHLDRSHQLVPAIGGGQDQIGKDLHLADSHRRSLILPDIGDHVVPALEPDLQEADNPVMLELFANWTDQYRAHVTSRDDMRKKRHAIV